MLAAHSPRCDGGGLRRSVHVERVPRRVERSFVLHLQRAGLRAGALAADVAAAVPRRPAGRERQPAVPACAQRLLQRDGGGVAGGWVGGDQAAAPRASPLPDGLGLRGVVVLPGRLSGVPRGARRHEVRRGGDGAPRLPGAAGQPRAAEPGHRADVADRLLFRVEAAVPAAHPGDPLAAPHLAVRVGDGRGGLPDAPPVLPGVQLGAGVVMGTPSGETGRRFRDVVRALR